MTEELMTKDLIDIVLIVKLEETVVGILDEINEETSDKGLSVCDAEAEELNCCHVRHKGMYSRVFILKKVKPGQKCKVILGNPSDPTTTLKKNFIVPFDREYFCMEFYDFSEDLE